MYGREERSHPGPISLIYLLLFFLILFSVFNPVKAEEAEGDSPGSERVLMKAGNLQYTEGRYEGTGGISLFKGDIVVNGQKGVLITEDNRADVSGDIFLEHSKGEIEAEELTAWLKEDRYLFKEGVNLLQQLTDGDFILKGPEVELALNPDSFTATGGVVINYKQRTLKGETVIYNDQDETLELMENVLIEEEDGDWISCKKAIFHLDTEEFTAEGDIELELEI